MQTVHVHRHRHGPARGHRRPVYALALAGLAAFAEAGCSSLGESTTASDATPAAAASSATSTSDAALAPADDSTTSAGSSGAGCDRALSDVSHYGPSTVKLLADGRESVTKAAVQLLVDGLDGAADAAGLQRLCVQRLVGSGWRTAMCGPVEFGTGGRLRATLPSSANGVTWLRALLQAIGRGPRRRPVTDLVSNPVAAVLAAPCHRPQWQTTSRSAVSLSSVDNGIATASVVRSK